MGYREILNQQLTKEEIIYILNNTPLRYKSQEEHKLLEDFVTRAIYKVSYAEPGKVLKYD